MRRQVVSLLAVLGITSFAADSVFKAPQDARDYAAAMKAVAKKFTGTPGVFLHLGDSITHANPYTAWARHGGGKSEEEKAFLKWSHCGGEKQKDGYHLASVDAPGGRSETAAGGITAGKYLAGGHNGLPKLEELLKKYNPQMVVYMLGTNDLRGPTPVEKYIADVEKAMDMIIANGTVPILSTLPPFKGREEACDAYNKALRELAKKKSLPLIDLYTEMKTRAGDKLLELIPDGVHLNAHAANGPPTEENLAKGSYLLRGYLSVRKGMEVKAYVFDAK
ncbi:MAG TPA: SGNH/GDSL hydrolase family protein [Planctomycetota bacterium]|nr:SGNH/GDSL hydrolase family protein [Planctomycetota bacterium]